MTSQLPVPQWCVKPTAPTEVIVDPPLEFSEVYEAWFDEVSRWVRAMGGPEADREDLVQDVFVVVYRRLPDFDGRNFGGWLYQIARRRVRDFRRLRWVKSALFSGNSVLEGIAKKGPGPADSAETEEKRRILERLLERLNESERAALVLFEIDGYAGEEIARIQCVPVNTVWARIHKARKKLKAQLERLEKGDQRRVGS